MIGLIQFVLKELWQAVDAVIDLEESITIKRGMKSI